MTKKEILVVDDESVIRELFDFHFSEKGYIVHGAASAEEALNILSEKSIHVMFLDLQLPGMNGLDLCKKIKNDLPAALVFAMTGFTSVFDFLKCRRAGFDDYFPKPFEVSLLDSVVDDAFNKLDRWKRKKK